jgi:LysM repeat protein
VYILLYPKYNLSMKYVLLFCIVLLSACAGQTVVPQIPLQPGNLQPYLTITPSLTPEHPDGLVESFETPLPTPTPFLYTVQAGDNMSSIALKFGVSLDELLAANPDVSPNAMAVGTELQIPSSPAGVSGVSTPTPVPASVEEINCHPTADGGMWCFVLVQNDSNDLMENYTAQVTLLDENDQPFISAVAISPLNILPPKTSLPLTVFFPPQIPSSARPQAQILTGVRLLPDEQRYLPATINNIIVQIAWNGRSAHIRGQIFLPADSQPANQIWVAAVAYDEHERVIGIRRWESNTGLAPGDNLPFEFDVASLAARMVRVALAVEARP